MIKFIYLLPALISFIAGLLCFVGLKKHERLTSVIGSFLTLLTVIISFKFNNYITQYFYVDFLSKIFLLIISIIYFTTSLFSIEFLRYLENRLIKVHDYFMLLNLFSCSMFLAVILNNFGFIWVAIEATTFTSALIVATENDEIAIEAAWRYIIIVSSALTISLISTIFIYSSQHTLLISELIKIIPNNKLFLLASMLAVIGYGAKAGIFPMYTWLPDVHGKAPSTVSAIFSSVLLPVALYPIIRIFQIYNNIYLSTFTFVLGVLTVITAVLITGSQKLYKRLFAYSSIENMGMALIGISIYNKLSLLGVVILILSHALAKSGIFYLTGNLLHKYGTKKIEEVKGVIKILPKTGLFLFLGSLAVTGAPPFGTFVGEIIILSQMVKKFGIIISIILFLLLCVGFLFIQRKVINMVFTTPINIKNNSNFSENWYTFIPAINIILSALVILLIPIIYLMLQGV